MSEAALVGNLSPADDLRRDRSGHLVERRILDRAANWLLPLLYLVAIAPILDLVYWIGVRAVPTLTWQVITTNPSGEAGGLWAPLVGSIDIILLATGVAVAFGFLGGLATAEYLSERAAGVVRVSANVFAGTPAIILGLFGYFALVEFLGWGPSLAAASVTLGIFMTPYVFRATDIAYASIPSHIREAAVGSGARPIQYLLKVATPIAFPQVLTGVFLAMAIGVGETAPLVLTTNQYSLPPTGLFSKAGALPLNIWGAYQNPVSPSIVTLAFQAAFLLLVVVVGLNVIVRIISARSRRRLEGLFQ
jgi:phosphate transport system permease protein